MGFAGVSGSSGNQGANFQIVESSSEKASNLQASQQGVVDSSASSEATVSAQYTTQAGEPLLSQPAEEQDLSPSIGVLSSTDLEDINLDMHYKTTINTVINNKGLSAEEAGQVRFAIDNPDDPNIPNPIRQKAQEILKGAKEEMVKEGSVPNDWEPPVADGDAFAVLYGQVADAVLEEVIENSGQEITPQQKMNLKFALYHPEKASPEALSMLENLGVKTKIATFFADRPENYTLPTNWQPNTSLYDSQTEDSAEANFSRAVMSFAASHNLSADEQTLLNTKYYNANAVLPDKLQGIFNQLMEKLASIMPVGWTPSPDQAFFQGEVSAELRYENHFGAQEYIKSHSLDASKAALLLKAMADPTDPSIPQELREAATSILEGTRKAMIAKYQLSDSWQPTGDVLPTESPVTEYRVNVLQNLDQLQASFSVILSQIPNSPERVLILDALKVISDALKGLRETIYRMESLEALAGKDITLARKESAIYKAEKNYEQMEKMRKEQAKIERAKKKGKLISNIMLAVTVVAAVVAVAVTILSFGTLGPVAVGLMLTLIAISTTDTAMQAAGVNFTLMGAAFDGVADGAGFLAESAGLPSDGVKTVKILTKVALIIIVCLAASAAGGGGVAVSMVASQMFSSSGVTKETAVACGADPQTAMYIDIAVTSAVAIASIAYSMNAASKVADRAVLIKKATDAANACAVKGAAAGNKATQLYYKVMEAFYRLQVKLLQNPSANTALKMLNKTSATTEMTSSGLGVYNGKVNYDIQNMHADVARAKASFDANQAKLSDQIEALKQAVKKLQDLLSQFISMLAGVGKAQTKVWSDNQTQYPA